MHLVRRHIQQVSFEPRSGVSGRSIGVCPRLRSHRLVSPRGRLPRGQRGIGMLALLVIAMMVGFFAMSGIKIVPSYTEYLTVKQISIRVAKEYVEDEDTIADIRRALAGYLNTNQVKGLDYRDVDIARKEGKIIIDASYEHRIPLVWRIDAVLKYDDLKFEAGVDYGE